MALCRKIWCPLCYAGVRGRAVYAGHAGYRPDRRGPGVSAMSFLQKREVAAARVEGGRVTVGLDEDVHRFEALLEFVGQEHWPDGTAREPGTLLLFVEDGKVKACLSDRAQSLVLFVSGRGLLEAMDAAESSLRNGKADWRRSRPRGQRGRG